MKILILTTATGQGHNSAAAALCVDLGALGFETMTADVLKSGKKNVSGPVSRLYNGMVAHAPLVFGALYHLGGLVSSSRVHSPIYYLNTLYSDAFYEKISALSPDVIVCTHIFSAQALTRLKEKGRLKTPAVGVMTDYTCSPFWEETRLEKYVIPSPLLREEFEKKGVPAGLIVPAGIPVDARFREKIGKEQARERLGIREKTVFTVMGGSMGFGDIGRICAALLQNMPAARVLAVCGNNKKLYDGLSGIRNITPFGFTRDVNLLMDAADVLLTKPGGLSATEAAVKRVPVVLTNPIPGGETCNAAFFRTLGMAAVARGPVRAAQEACRLAGNPELAEKMEENQERYINGDAGVRIAGLIADLAGMQILK